MAFDLTSIDWSTIMSIISGAFGGGWLVRLLIQRQLKQLDEIVKDIHSMKTDLAILKDRYANMPDLEARIRDTYGKILKIEGAISTIHGSGCHLYHGHKEHHN